MVVQWSMLLVYLYPAVGFILFFVVLSILSAIFFRKALKYCILTGIFLGAMSIIVGYKSYITNLLPNIENEKGKQMIEEVQKKNNEATDKINKKLNEMLKQ